MALNRAFKRERLEKIKDKFCALETLSGWKNPRRKILRMDRRKPARGDSFPAELFVCNFTKLKTCFGHKCLDSNELYQENEEMRKTLIKRPPNN